MSAGYRTEPDTLDAIRRDLDTLLALDPVLAAPATHAEAHARFTRRHLEAAAEHGAAMLAALDRPRLVTPGFVPLDREAIGDALDGVIAALDDLDGDPDLEDDDREHDTADAEEDLGWPACMSQIRLGPNTADGDATAPERHGSGFVLCGPDDAEGDEQLPALRGRQRMRSRVSRHARPGAGTPHDSTARFRFAIRPHLLIHRSPAAG